MYDNPSHGGQCLAEFKLRYNRLRAHWALIPEAGDGPLARYEVYVEGRKVGIPKWQSWAREARAKLDEMLSGDNGQEGWPHDREWGESCGGKSTTCGGRALASHPRRVVFAGRAGPLKLGAAPVDSCLAKHRSPGAVDKPVGSLTQSRSNNFCLNAAPRQVRI